jgi:hypothetical protein
MTADLPTANGTVEKAPDGSTTVGSTAASGIRSSGSGRR